MVLAKIWSESVYVAAAYIASTKFISMHLANQVVGFHVVGFVVGGILGGMLVDFFGAKRIFISSSITIAFTLISLIITSSLYLLKILFFIRAFCIALTYNSSYGLLLNFYHNNNFGAVMSRFYSVLFFVSSFTPVVIARIIEHHSEMMAYLFIIASILLVYVSIALYHIHDSHVQAIDSFNLYGTKFRLLLSNQEFMTMCIVSMIGMGGFYGFMPIFSMYIEKYSGSVSLGVIQSIGNVCTVSASIIFASLKITQINMLRKSILIGMIMIICASTYISIMVTSLVPYAIPGFLVFCIAKGFTHPACKTIALSQARQISKDNNIALSGMAQSLVTTFNSLLEMVASILLFYDLFDLFTSAIIFTLTIILLAIYIMLNLFEIINQSEAI